MPSTIRENKIRSFWNRTRNKPFVYSDLSATLGTPASDSVGATYTVTKNEDSSVFSYPDAVMGTDSGGYRGTNPLGTTNALPYTIEFGFYGQAFEFRFRRITTIAKYRVFVDGKIVDLGGSATGVVVDAGGANSPYKVLIDLGETAHHRVRIETTNVIFNGVYHRPIDTIYRLDDQSRSDIAILGDSFTAGTGASNLMDGFAMTLGRIMNSNVWNYGIGGSGYLNNTGSGKFETRTSYLENSDARLVIVAGGVNDITLIDEVTITYDTFQTAVENTFAGVIEALPNAMLVALNIWPANVTSYGTYLAKTTEMNSRIQTAVEAVDGKFLNIPSTDFTGSGNAGSTAGDGNRDVFLASDGAHPTEAGHLFIAERIVDLFFEVL